MANITVRFREVDRDKFEDIIAGRKTIETRAATEKYQNIESGDTLTAICGKNRIEKVISAVKFYKTPDALIDDLGYTEILPTAVSREEAIEIYYTFPGYREKIKEGGLVALHLK